MGAKTFMKNGNLRYIISTNQDLKANLKADLILGELRSTSDTTFVLNSRRKKEKSMQELAAMVQEQDNEVGKQLVYIIPKLWDVNLLPPCHNPKWMDY